MKDYKIAVIPGDGIGKEVMHEGIKILQLIAKVTDQMNFTFEHYDWGCEYYTKHGKMMDEDGLQQLEQYDAILLGAVGFPGVPDHISLRELLLKIRQGFNQYVNLRPVKLLTDIDCPLKHKGCDDIDMIFVRENTEGEYAGIGGIYKEGQEDEFALQTAVFTRKTTRDVMRYAFELARRRNRLKKVTSVTKSNALNYSMVFWDKIFREVAEEYPDIQTESFHVDATTMYMLQKPEELDVLVASNLFGDILTDLGAVLQGGIGFASGANINPEKEYPPMFEPVHGSAPAIAGKGLANPIAMIWTVKLLLDFLDYEDIGASIIQAIRKVLKERNYLTPDMGGMGTTSSVCEKICRELQNILQ